MKKKILILALVLAMIPIVPQSAASAMSHKIYNLDFENGDIMFMQNGAEVTITDDAHSGEKSVSIENYDAVGKTPRLALTNLNTKARSNISAWIKTDLGTTTVKMILYTIEGGNEKQYVLAKKTVSDKWTEISADVMTTFKNISGPLTIGFIGENSEGYTKLYIDDIEVVSSVPSVEMSKEESKKNANTIEKIVNDGNFMIRATFESGTLEKLGSKAENADYFIKDDVLANSGTKYLEISNRIASTGTLLYYLDGIDPMSVVDISCYLRNIEGEKARRYLWQAMIPTPEKNVWVTVGAAVNATDSSWVKLSGTLDLSQYEVTGTPMVQIVATQSLADGRPYYWSYLVDDVKISANKPGTFYDDTLYVDNTVKDPLISDTPWKESVEYMPVQEDIPAMKDVYKDYFKVGMTVWDKLEDNERYGRLLKKHFNSLVSNGVHKLPALCGTYEPGREYSKTGKFVYGNADDLMDFAASNGIEIVGHTLFWDLKNRPLSTELGENYTRDDAIAFMKEATTKVIRHFEGDGEAEEYERGYDISNWHMDTWDVVNEAVTGFNQDGSLRYTNGGVSYYNAIGEEYIDLGFKFAEETGYKDIKFRYNDYNNLAERKKTESVYQLIKGLKERGRKVDIIGMQSHYFADLVDLDEVDYEIARYASVVDEVDITELDIRVYTDAENAANRMFFENGVTRERENTQASLYGQLFEIYKKHSDVINRVTLWTLMDKYSWTNTHPFVHKEYCAPFDRNYQAKPAYWAIVDPDKFYNELLGEDVTKTKFRVDSVNIANPEGIDSFMQDGVLYNEAVELLKVMGEPCVVVNGKLSFIAQGDYYEMTGGTKAINKAFKPAELKNATIEKDGKIYLPTLEIAEIMGYRPILDARRNVVSLRK